MAEPTPTRLQVCFDLKLLDSEAKLRLTIHRIRLEAKRV